MTNACIFCGDQSRRLTDEHVPASVARKVLGVSGYLIHERTTDGEVTNQWRTPADKGVAKVLCDKCNNDWLGRLDAAMERRGSSVLLGKKTTVRPKAQRIVAAWGLKTAMVLQHVSKSRAPIIPASHYRQFYKLGQPPPGVIILFSRYVEDSNNRSGLLLRSISENLGQHVSEPPFLRDSVATGAKMYAITMTVGHAVWQIFGHDTSIRIEIEISATAGRAVERIWPIQGTFWWPPHEAVIGETQLHELHARIRSGSSLQ